MINEIEKLFFELIRVSIGMQVCLSHTPSADEWGELYSFAKKQSLVGVCFAGVQKLVAQQQEPPEMLYLTWMGMAAKIQQRNEVVNNYCLEICNRFSRDERSFCIMKGQQVGSYYETPMLRQSGDIDVFMLGGFKSVSEYIKSISETNQMTHQHIALNLWNDCEVEVHYRAAETHRPFKNMNIQKWFSGQKFHKRQSEYLAGMVVPTWDFNVIHSILHSFMHYLGEGIGIRQAMDLYYILVNKPNDASDIEGLLRRFGLLRFAQGMMAVMENVFGLDPKFLVAKPDYMYGQFVLDDIMAAGNLGHDSAFYKSSYYKKAFYRFINGTIHTARLLRYHPIDVIMDPFWRAYNFCWMKAHGYEY